MKPNTSLLALALALASPAAFADTANGAMKMPMAQSAEQHQMGMRDMTPEQHKMMAEKMWTDMDANKDGSISRAEYDAHLARMMAMHAQMHEGMDRTGADDRMKAGSHAAHEAAEDSTKAAHASAEATKEAAEAAAKHK